MLALNLLARPRGGRYNPEGILPHFQVFLYHFLEEEAG